MERKPIVLHSIAIGIFGFVIFAFTIILSIGTYNYAIISKELNETRQDLADCDTYYQKLYCCTKRPKPNIYNKWTEDAIKAQITVTTEWQISVAQYLSDALRNFTNNDGTFRDSYSACEYLTIKIKRKFGGGWICNFGKFKIYESEDFFPSFSQVPMISDFVYFSLDNEESVMIIRIV